MYIGTWPFPCQAFWQNLHMFEALKRAFQLNFTCLVPRNANGTNSGAPEWRSSAIWLTLTTEYVTWSGSETWPVRKENELALQRAEMRMVRWMCGVKLKDTVSDKELRETRNSRHNVATTANQVTMVWTCVSKG